MYVFFQVDSCSDESTFQIDLRRGPLTNDTYEVFVRYCTGGIWHYLCSGGVGWTSTLATVACRQLGYTYQGEKIHSFSDNQQHASVPSAGVMYGAVGDCNMNESTQIKKFFRLKQACVGNEMSLELCGQAVDIVTGCTCGQVGSITCQAMGKNINTNF